MNLDGIHSLDISIDEEKKTVVTELITLDDEPVMIYAEKFNKPCDYLKKGIRRGIEYLNCFNKIKEDLWKSTKKE